MKAATESLHNILPVHFFSLVVSAGVYVDYLGVPHYHSVAVAEADLDVLARDVLVYKEKNQRVMETSKTTRADQRAAGL